MREREGKKERREIEREREKERERQIYSLLILSSILLARSNSEEQNNQKNQRNLDLLFVLFA